MPSLSFKKEFAPLIQSGQKVHTIRAATSHKNGKTRFKPGDDLYFYTGMRTKHCQPIEADWMNPHPKTAAKNVMPCTYVKSCTIYPLQKKVFVGGVALNSLGIHIEAFAQCDGFTSTDELFRFFIYQVDETMLRPRFDGLLIGWTQWPYS